MTSNSSRGPLPFIILASTGQDVRDCINCELCYHTLEGIDITFNEVMQAAARNDLSILENPILWNCDTLLESNLTCMGGIDIAKVIHTLRDEAEIRGFKF
jgi:heterodisulfide reductase subunit C